MFSIDFALTEKLQTRYLELNEVNIFDGVQYVYSCGCYGTCRNTCGESCYQR